MNDASITESSVGREVSTTVVMGINKRRRYRGGPAEPAELRLLPVRVTPDQPEGTAPARAGEGIEIGLAGRYRVRVSEGIRAATLRLVLEVLERR